MRRLIPTLAAAMVAASASAQSTPAATPAAPPAAAPAQLAGPPCANPEFRQLDFWVGEWDLEFTQADGSIGRAENRITKDEYGACVIAEHFRQPGGNADGRDYVGTSHSTYDVQTKSWRQTWVDNGGSWFDLRGGPVAGQKHVFEFVNLEPRGPAGLSMRMIWEEVTPNSLVWRWQAKQGEAWQDRWVLRYRRKA